MKKTFITIALLIFLTGLSVKFYEILIKQTPPDPSPIDLIMQEPTFQASIKIQAENIHLDRQKAIIEKRKEELRKEELNLASTTKSVLK